MDGWDVALLVGVSYLAVMILVRLMLAQRNRLLAEFRRQIETAQARKKEAKEKEAKAQAARKGAA
jgi:heme exporter protein D